MNQKIGCVLRKITHFLVIMALAFSITVSDSRPAHAAMVVHDPISMAKSVYEWGRNHVEWALDKADRVRKFVQDKLDHVLNRKNATENTDKQINNQAVIASEQAALQGRFETHNAAVNAQADVAVESAEEIREARDVAAALCQVSSAKASTEGGGLAGDEPDGQVVSGAGAARPPVQVRFNRYRREEGKPAPSGTSAQRDMGAKDDADKSGGGTNNVGSPGAQGPRQYYSDQAKTFLHYFCTPENFGGAMGKAGVCGNTQEVRAGIDTRASELLSGGATMHLPCMNEEKRGVLLLGKWDTQKCPRASNQSWEVIEGESGLPGISLGTAYVIRDYLTPGPLDPYSSGFLQALGRGDQAANELFAKRQSFNAQQSLVDGIIHQAIARRTPQSLDEDGRKVFVENYKRAFPETPDKEIPRDPSMMLRRDVMIERFRLAEQQFKDAGMTTGAIIQQSMAWQTEALAYQRDTLYALERIEMLLATMLSNDLRDRRDQLQGQVTSANERYGTVSGEAEAGSGSGEDNTAAGYDARAREATARAEAAQERSAAARRRGDQAAAQREADAARRATVEAQNYRTTAETIRNPPRTP